MIGDGADWIAPAGRVRIAALEAGFAGLGTDGLAAALEGLVAENRAIHEVRAINLDPAANVMNPRAERLLAAGLGSRPSLGHPGAKYETGLAAIEGIEVLAARLARELFDATFAEIRLGSGAIANLAAFMACCQPGDAVIVPPAAVGGHVTHHLPGAAGLYGLRVFEAPADPDRYSVDLAGLGRLAERVQPRLISLGGSLNLLPHPVAAVRGIADAVGARLLFDAAHLSGPIAGRAWPNPLAEGADLMTMSTYKSLGGPPGGLVLTRDPALARAVDRVVFPGLTANPDPGRAAALAMALLDWRAHGAAAAAEMLAAARTLAAELYRLGLPVFFAGDTATRSHALALEAAAWGGGQAMAERLGRAGLLASGIGLPLEAAPGAMAGLRLGTPEIVRRGMRAEDMGGLAALIGRALAEPPETVAPAVTAFRARFAGLHFVLG